MAIVALDVLVSAPALRDPIARERDRLGLDALWVVATHTHSGPGGYLDHRLAGLATGAGHRAGAADRISRAAVRALEAALADRAPARLGAVTIDTDLAQNRRRRGGPRESRLHLLRIDAEARDPIALMIVGAHPTAVSARVRAASADYPGALRRWLAARDWRAIVVPGALGDQGPGVDARDVDAARLALGEIAERVGGPALRSLERIRTGARNSLAGASVRVSTPRTDLRFPCALWWLAPWTRSAAHALRGAEVEVRALRAGDVRILGVPAEPTRDVGERLRSLDAQAPPWVISHSDGWLGYVVTTDEYRRGGYESCMSLLGPRGAGWLAEASAEALRLLDSAP